MINQNLLGLRLPLFARPYAPTALLAAVLLSVVAVLGAPRADAAEAPIDHWPTDHEYDKASLQRGARIFVNYCLNCHSARQMRWNRLHDIGIEDAQIKSELIFGDQKVGDVMTVAMNPVDAKVWFGKAPPDLSVIVRARSTEEHKGTDYIYSLLRGFYRDRSTITGWNNVVYPNIAMPNILWQLQGPRVATITTVEPDDHPPAGGTPGGLVRKVSVYDASGNVEVSRKSVDGGATGEEVSFTSLDPAAAKAYDAEVADLVGFLNWMSEPNAESRYRIGVWVMGFLVVFLLVARWLNKVYWRDIK